MSLTLLGDGGVPGLIAIDKPAGTIVLPGVPGEDGVGEPCLRDLLAAQLGREVWPVHRIDRDTSGVLLFALEARLHREISMLWEEGGAKKRYLALVQGRIPRALDITLPLAPARKRKMRVARPDEPAKECRTLVRPRQCFAKATLVECEPLTGRQHQLRVHLMATGHPLLFDHQYGRRQPLLAKDVGGEGDEVVLARTPLHAQLLELPSLGFSVTSPVPADIARCVALLTPVA